MILNDLEPVYIYPNYNKEYESTTGVNPDDIKEALEENDDIKVVVLTSPIIMGFVQI